MVTVRNPWGHVSKSYAPDPGVIVSTAYVTMPLSTFEESFDTLNIASVTW